MLQFICVFVNIFVNNFKKYLSAYLFTYLSLWCILFNQVYEGLRMKLTLNTLEIKILLKCDKCNAGLISKSDITQFFRASSREERVKAINSLIANKLLVAREMPKAGSNKTPVFYELTNDGKKWIDDYNENYPE